MLIIAQPPSFTLIYDDRRWSVIAYTNAKGQKRVKLEHPTEPTKRIEFETNEQAWRIAYPFIMRALAEAEQPVNDDYYPIIEAEETNDAQVIHPRR